MKIRKLTPAILKKIIAEEKAKISNGKSRKITNVKNVSRKSLIERKVDQLTKLALLEAKEKIRILKIKKAREAIKKSLK